MVRNLKGEHHISVRKRIHVKHETYPHPNKWKRFLDKIICPVAFIGPIMTIPQVWTIWIEKNASGVSATSWLSYAILSCIWLVYGISHKEKPIILSSVAWIILDILIGIGALIY